MELQAPRWRREPNTSSADQLERQLHAHNVTVGVAQLNAHPLATSRERLIIYVSCDPLITGERLAQECESLAAKVREACPQHHLSTVLTQSQGSRAKETELSATDEAKEKARYYTAFAAALDKAVKKARLPTDLSLPPMESRPSCRHAALACRSGWLRAQADVYWLIANHEALLTDCQAC